MVPAIRLLKLAGPFQPELAKTFIARNHGIRVTTALDPLPELVEQGPVRMQLADLAEISFPVSHLVPMRTFIAAAGILDDQE